MWAESDDVGLDRIRAAQRAMEGMESDYHDKMTILGSRVLPSLLAYLDEGIYLMACGETPGQCRPRWMVIGYLDEWVRPDVFTHAAQEVFREYQREHLGQDRHVVCPHCGSDLHPGHHFL